VLDQTPVPTIYAGEYNYMKQGLYWNASITSVGVLYHDRTIIGTTMADVAPELCRRLRRPPTPARLTLVLRRSRMQGRPTRALAPIRVRPTRSRTQALPRPIRRQRRPPHRS